MTGSISKRVPTEWHGNRPTEYVLNTFKSGQLESTEMSEGEPLTTIIWRAKQRVESGLADRAEVVDSNNYVVFRLPRAAVS